MNQIKKIKLLLFVFATIGVNAQNTYKKWPDIISKNKDSWFATDEAKAIAENVLLYQRDNGAWPKNIQMQEELTPAKKEELIALKKSTKDCTTDNGATTQEMLFMSKMYKQIKDERYKESFMKGLDYLFQAQYENGGWPQFFPLKKGYYTHITYNDNLMVNILNIMREISYETDYLSIKPSKEIVEKAKISLDKGVACILKTQYKQNGVLTVWCAQHDETTFAPANARAYELASLSGKESAKIVLFLMSLKNPSPEVITAVQSGYAWFEKTKITNLKEERIVNDEGKVTGKKIIPTENAAPLWARFSELDTNEPFFCDRDGVKKKSLTEIGEERRNGYTWYSNEPKEVLKKYRRWARKNNVKTDDAVEATETKKE